MGLEDRDAVQEKVAEIGGVQGLQAGPDRPRKARCPGCCRRPRRPEGTRSGVSARFFQPSMRLASSRAGQRFSSMFGVSDQLLQQADLVVGVEDGEGRLQADQFGMAAQDLGRQRVEGAHPGHPLGRPRPRGDPHAFLHLARGLVGEGHGKDFVRSSLARSQEDARSARSAPWSCRCPAPASIRTGPSSASTASRWAGFRSSKIGAPGGRPAPSLRKWHGSAVICRLKRLRSGSPLDRPWSAHGPNRGGREWPRPGEELRSLIVHIVIGLCGRLIRQCHRDGRFC